MRRRVAPAFAGKGPGVKITFGSDAHNLYEVGEFALHLDLVERAGFNGDLKDIMIDPRKG